MARSVAGLRAGIAAAAALAAAALVAPPAVAAEQPGLRVAKNADSQTRAVIQAAPQAAAAAATACGPGYVLSRAIPLPEGTDPRSRLATLFNYTKNGNDGGCSIFDNNVGSSRHMKISVCDSQRRYCDVNEGNFSQYAGPVFTGYPVCATVTAQMWSGGGAPYIDYKTQYAYLCD
ncbi:hypothetical protein [Streptomyces blastmyceticus]|uniref:Secreted protein n=1 Tax=Streptomyces blastmyceticus TaxID=68180 RepID=A0ABP3HRI5_9ACTN